MKIKTGVSNANNPGAEQFPDCFNDLCIQKYEPRADEIREHARSTLQVYLSDSDYKYLRENISRLTEEQKKQISIVNVLNYVEGLKDAIENDELVWMRRHEEPDIYLDSFRECRARTEKIFKAGRKIPEGQLSIFDLFEV